MAFLKSKGREVIYDAEHFFDGYKADPAYALATLQAAEEAGADILVLCDTNGGTLTADIGERFQAAAKQVKSAAGNSHSQRLRNGGRQLPLPPCNWAPCRCRAPSTAMENGAGTPTSAR